MKTVKEAMIQQLKLENNQLKYILDTLEQDMVCLNGCGTKSIKPKSIFDRIVFFKGVDKE